MPNFNTVTPPHATDACADAKKKGIACRNVQIGDGSIPMTADHRTCKTAANAGNNKKEHDKYCKELNPDFDYVGGSADAKWPNAQGGKCRVAVCKRVRNGASPEKCCRNVSDGLRSCDDKYSIGNPACDAPLSAYCVGSRLVTDKACAEWAKTGSSQARTNMSGYCADNMNLKDCKDWCRSSAAKGSCDRAVSDWCKLGANADDDYCRCFKNETKGGVRRPDCFDSVCVTDGYMTQTQIANKGNCGTLVECTQNVYFDGVDNVIEQNEIIQNCEANNYYAAPDGSGGAHGDDAKKPANDAKKPGDDAKDPAADPKKPADDAMDPMMIFMIVLIILCICGGVGFYIYKRHQTTPTYSVN